MKLFGNKVFGLESSMYKLFWPVVLLLFFFFFSLKMFVLPRVDEISVLSKKFLKIKGDASELDKKLSYLESIDEGELKKRLVLLTVALLEGKDVYYLVNVIDHIAGEFNFSTDSFSVSPGEMGDGNDEGEDDVVEPDLVNVPVSIVLYGPKNRYLDLLKRIEKALPILVINQLEMAAGDDVVKLELIVSTFFAERKEFESKPLLLKDLKLSKEEEELFERLSEFEGLDSFLAKENKRLDNKGYIKYEGRDPFRL